MGLRIPYWAREHSLFTRRASAGVGKRVREGATARHRRYGLLALADDSRHCSYQSECGDQRWQERHWVSVQRWRQAGQTPPVSNVFHACLQVQAHRSSLRGDHPHCGHRMRGPEGPTSFLPSRSRSRTGDESRSASVSIGLLLCAQGPKRTKPSVVCSDVIGSQVALQIALIL
jgi:hypothetical protein